MVMNKTAPFIGRANEQAYLRRLLKKKTSSLVVIKGRRRIGKSRLAAEFAKGMTFYRFSGLPPTSETTDQDQRNEFANQLSTQTGFPVLRYEDWHQVFMVLGEKIKSGRVIVLLDEISWMGSKDPTFLGKLKNAWDMYYQQNAELILILCGSVSQWIEENILSSTGFFGRVAQELTLEELPLQDCNQMLEGIGFKGSPYEKLMLLSITGGVPWYLENIHPGLSAVDNIKALCFEKDALLVKEYEKIFHDLFSSQGTTSQRIVECLVRGAKEYGEISDEVRYPSGGPLSHYLDALVNSGFVALDKTWSLKTGRPVNVYRYRLRDNYLRFYLRYIAPHRHQIDLGRYADMSVSSLPAWDSIMGLQFENLVLNNRDLIQKALGICPEDIVIDNPFFQRKTTRQQGCQVDYLIQTRHRTLYACEVEFLRGGVGRQVADEMAEKIARLRLPMGVVCHPVLIHVSQPSTALAESDYFYRVIDFAELLEQ